MKIIKPYAKIAELQALGGSTQEFERMHGIRLLRHCEWAGRISHRSEDKITEDSYDRFIRFIVMEKGDFSIIEHASVTVEAVVDRGITHEWVRHRLGSYTQESTRFVNYNKGGKEPEFIIPFDINDKVLTLLTDAYKRMLDDYEINYKFMLENFPPQIARSVLPNALASKIIVTYNLRNWRHFFIMRTTKETHPQFREVSIPLLKEFQEKIPILFEDIVPESKQSENLKMMR